MNHKMDTDKQVFFYEQEFYVLSNFSAFKLKWQAFIFDTSEAAYQWMKFCYPQNIKIDRNLSDIRYSIRCAISAHDSYKIAEREKAFIRPDWLDIRVDVMEKILRAKARQHPYVKKKLLETGSREIIEDSWRDPFWGWGPDRDGENMLGKLWMKIREDIK